MDIKREFQSRLPADIKFVEASRYGAHGRDYIELQVELIDLGLGHAIGVRIDDGDLSKAINECISGAELWSETKRGTR